MILCYNPFGEVKKLEKEKKEFLERLFLENYSFMEYYATRFFRNQNLAQDVVQDTFLIAQAKIDRLMASESPKGWLFNTLKNVIGNTYKQQKRLADMVSIDDCDIPAATDISVEATYRTMIPDEDLQLLIWIYCEERPYSEAAERLGISLAACKKRIQRARLRFKAAYEKHEN